MQTQPKIPGRASLVNPVWFVFATTAYRKPSRLPKNWNLGSVALFRGLVHPRDVVHGPACGWFLTQQGSVGTAHLTSHPTQLLLTL